MVNTTRIIATAMASASSFLTFPRRPLMGLEAPKATRSALSDLAVVCGLGWPPGSATPPARIAGGVTACMKESLYLPLNATENVGSEPTEYLAVSEFSGRYGGSLALAVAIPAGRHHRHCGGQGFY